MPDLQIPNGSGTFTAKVVDNNGAPSNQIDATQPFDIEFDLTLAKGFSNILGKGNWVATAYADIIGPGTDVVVGSKTVSHTAGTLGYKDKIKADTSKFSSPPAAGESGVYKMVTVLTWDAGAGVTQLSAVDDGPVVRIA